MRNIFNKNSFFNNLLTTVKVCRNTGIHIYFVQNSKKDVIMFGKLCSKCRLISVLNKWCNRMRICIEVVNAIQVRHRLEKLSFSLLGIECQSCSIPMPFLIGHIIRQTESIFYAIDYGFIGRSGRSQSVVFTQTLYNH